MRVAIVVNTRIQDDEFQVEYDPPHTIELIRHGIEAAGHECLFIEADEDVSENLKAQRPDLVFNRAEGVRGESRESHVPAILEMLGIPYIGSNVLTTAVGLNKAWTKKVLHYHGILTPRFHVANSLEEAETFDIVYPSILKPNEEGSSVGINEDNVVHSKEQMLRKLGSMLGEYQQNILIEQFIQGREFSVGMLGRSGKTPEILPITEVDFSKLPPEVGGVFGQRAKTKYDEIENYSCPAKISDELRNRLETTTLAVCTHLDVVDFGRIDFRMDSAGDLYFLEINPLPGMDFDMDNKDFSFFPYMASKAGYSYDELIRRLIESACYRYGL
ncbi:MAG: ATP-grasp domain-containing protein [Candidatus Thorarchaeota archaeon]